MAVWYATGKTWQTHSKRYSCASPSLHDTISSSSGCTTSAVYTCAAGGGAGLYSRALRLHLMSSPYAVSAETACRRVRPGVDCASLSPCVCCAACARPEVYFTHLQRYPLQRGQAVQVAADDHLELGALLLTAAAVKRRRPQLQHHP